MSAGLLREDQAGVWPLAPVCFCPNMNIPQTDSMSSTDARRAEMSRSSCRSRLHYAALQETVLGELILAIRVYAIKQALLNHEMTMELFHLITLSWSIVNVCEKETTFLHKYFVFHNFIC